MTKVTRLGFFYQFFFVHIVDLHANACKYPVNSRKSIDIAMTNTLPNLESRLAALESDLAEQKQVNADLRQRVADLEAFKERRERALAAARKPEPRKGLSESSIFLLTPMHVLKKRYPDLVERTLAAARKTLNRRTSEPRR